MTRNARTATLRIDLVADGGKRTVPLATIPFDRVSVGVVYDDERPDEGTTMLGFGAETSDEHDERTGARVGERTSATTRETVALAGAAAMFADGAPASLVATIVNGDDEHEVGTLTLAYTRKGAPYLRSRPTSWRNGSETFDVSAEARPVSATRSRPEGFAITLRGKAAAPVSAPVVYGDRDVSLADLLA